MRTDPVPAKTMKPLSSTALAIKEQQTQGYMTRIIASSVVTITCMALGFYLVLKGAVGEFKFEGANMFLRSLAPGLFFVMGGILIMLAALARHPYFRSQAECANDAGFTETKG